ncbi:MAG: glycosyltransferase [Bacteriodetes bacterium]|nr:glycosyltransferase [Bacteroidota bacterium]
MEKRTPTLGVAIIVRNAASTIAKAIESVKFLAKQIVVIDTGSTDGTPVIATRLGAEVYHFTWTNDFSEARNHALRHMRTDWILSLDADETFDEESFLKEHALLYNQAVGGIQLNIINALSYDGGTQHSHSYTRLFRRDVRIRYTGSVHEQVAESIRTAGFTIAESCMQIYHYGYAEPSPEKVQRNLELLRKEREQHPNDVWLQYHLGLTEFAAGNLREAEQLLTPVLGSKQLSAEQQELAQIRAAQIALAHDHLLRVEQLLNFTSNDVHREGLRLFVLAAAKSIQQYFADALTLFTQPATMESHLVEQQHRAHAAASLQKVLAAQTPRTEYMRTTTSSGDDVWLGMFK